MLEEDCSDIKSGCHDARTMLKNRARMSAIDPGRIIFITYSIPKLNNILAGFKESRDGIDKTIAVIMTDIAALNAAKASRDRSEKEKQKLTRQIEQLKKAQEEEKKAREKSRKEREKDTAMILSLYVFSLLNLTKFVESKCKFHQFQISVF